MSGERFPRRWHLRSAADLTVVLRNGQRRRTPRLDIAWRGNTLGHPRLGVIVPRHGASIVQRNRLRRRLREIARRRLLPALGAVDVVIRSCRGAHLADFQTLATDLDEWQRSLSGSPASPNTRSSA